MMETLTDEVYSKARELIDEIEPNGWNVKSYYCWYTKIKN